MTSKQSERGFTMAELLVVVAIIAVLVAIAIPVFGAQLEKSRQAVDLANVRSAYAALQISKIEGTLPDGSPDNEENRGKVYFYYTSNGFIAANAASLKDVGIQLVSNSNCNFLLDFITLPSEVYEGWPIPTSVNGYYIIAHRKGDYSTAVLTLYPAEWA